MTKTEKYLLMLVKRTIKNLDGLTTNKEEVYVSDIDTVVDSLEIDIGIRRGCEDKLALDEIVKNYYKQ